MCQRLGGPGPLSTRGAVWRAPRLISTSWRLGIACVRPHTRAGSAVKPELNGCRYPSPQAFRSDVHISGRIGLLWVLMGA